MMNSCICAPGCLCVCPSPDSTLSGPDINSMLVSFGAKDSAATEHVADCLVAYPDILKALKVWMGYGL